MLENACGSRALRLSPCSSRSCSQVSCEIRTGSGQSLGRLPWLLSFLRFASTAVLITGRLGIGWVGQVIAGLALAWLGRVDIAILLVAVFPGHFFI